MDASLVSPSPPALSATVVEDEDVAVNGSSGSQQLQLPWQIRAFGMAYYPALMLVGCLSNAMVILVMRRTRSMSKSRDVFTLLAVADTCVLLVNPGRYFVLLAGQRDIRLHSHVLCVAHTFLTYFLKEAATWILVLMTLERFLFARWPHKSSLYYRRRPKLAVWSVALLALLVKNLAIVFKLGVIRAPDGRATSCDSVDNDFRVAFFIVTLSLYSLLPFVLLTVFNVTLIRIIARANRRRQQMSVASSGACQHHHQHQQPQQQLLQYQQRQSLCHKASSTSTRPNAGVSNSATHVNRLLVPVCIIHILLTMPQCVFEILESTFKWKTDPTRRADTYTAGLLLVMLASLNNGINGFVYFFSSANFRKNFCQIFRRGVDSGGSGGAAFCRSTARTNHHQQQQQQQQHHHPFHHHHRPSAVPSIVVEGESPSPRDRRQPVRPSW